MQSWSIMTVDDEIIVFDNDEFDNEAEIIVLEPDDYIIVDLNNVVDLSYLGSKDYAFMETEVIRLTNLQREKFGLKPLSRNDDLCHSALLHTMDMAENHFISHAGSDGCNLRTRVDRTNYTNYFLIGENLAMGYPNPEQVVLGWMNSPGHRKNILKREFNEIGVAYIKAEIPTTNGKGYIKGGYWTQHFGYRKIK